MTRGKDFSLAISFIKKQCVEKIKQNNHKNHWHQETIEALMRGLQNEIDELQVEIYNIKHSINVKPNLKELKKTLPAAIMECADCINYLVFLSDNFKRMLDEK